MESLAGTEGLFIALLLTISVVALAAQRLRVPYTVALVLVGLALTFRVGVRPEVTSDLIRVLFVPPLVFEAAFYLELRELRAHLVQILMLAVPGVVLTTLIIGSAVNAIAGIPVAAALVFGALLSATDPVAVIALFRSFHISRRLSIIVEGESLLNDGTAIVVFNIALAAALTGKFDMIGGLGDFVRVSAGGIAVGAALGWLTARAIAQIENDLVETTLTTCLAFGAYLIAESLHLSGILAVLAAGLLCGQLGPEGMSPTTRLRVISFWEYLAFIANSLVFLLIGLTTNIADLLANLKPIGAALIAALLSRLIVVYGLSILLRRLRHPLPRPWQHVLFWGGLRGAIGLALALSLPADLAERDTLRAMTFGVVLFTLLAQGTTMQFLLNRLKLVQYSARDRERDTRWGRLYAAEAAWGRLTELHTRRVLTGDLWETLRAEHDQERERLAREMHAVYQEYSELGETLRRFARRESLRAERAALQDAFRRGLIADEAFRVLAAEVDGALDALPPDES